MIVHPTPTRLFRCRRAFIRFVVDPLILENAKDVGTMRAWAKRCSTNGEKPTPASPDVFLAITRSLVAAIDVRQNEFTRIRIATEQARQRWQLSKPTRETRRHGRARNLNICVRRRDARLYEDYERGLACCIFLPSAQGHRDSGFYIAASMREMIADSTPRKKRSRRRHGRCAKTRTCCSRGRKKNPKP